MISSTSHQLKPSLHPRWVGTQSPLPPWLRLACLSGERHPFPTTTATSRPLRLSIHRLRRPAIIPQSQPMFILPLAQPLLALLLRQRPLALLLHPQTYRPGQVDSSDGRTRKASMRVCKSTRLLSVPGPSECKSSCLISLRRLTDTNFILLAASVHLQTFLRPCRGSIRTKAPSCRVSRNSVWWTTRAMSGALTLARILPTDLRS